MYLLLKYSIFPFYLMIKNEKQFDTVLKGQVKLYSRDKDCC